MVIQVLRKGASFDCFYDNDVQGVKIQDLLISILSGMEFTVWFFGVVRVCLLSGKLLRRY